MQRPVIIFGAGASHALKDLQPSHVLSRHLHPPLTNELFDARFTSIIEDFDLIKEHLNKIQYDIGKGGNLESYLSKLSGRQDEVSQKQLIEIQLYLKKLFGKIQGDYVKPAFKNTIHYHTLIRDLANFFKQATLISFNYDLFLDQALAQIFEYQYHDIQSYYDQKDYELFKVHGSIDWAFPFENMFEEPTSTLKDAVNFVMRVKAGGAKFNPIKVGKGLRSNIYPYPALAIPTINNKGFILDVHQQKISERLRLTPRIILFGWSANDEYFAQEIIKNSNRKETVLVVVSPNSPEKIIDRLTPKEQPRNDWKKCIPIKKSFTEAVLDSELLAEICTA